MSDFFDEMFVGTPKNVIIKKVKGKLLSTPILHQDSEWNNGITLLVDILPTDRQLTSLINLVEKQGLHNYQILYPLTVELDEKDKTPLYKKYIDYKFDLCEYIPKGSKIMTMGRCMLTICESEDLDCSKIVEEDSNSTDKKAEKNSIIQGFYDTLLWKTSFFDPQTKTLVFPIDSWNDLNNKNGVWAENFEVWFFKKQIRLCKATEFKPRKIRKLNLEIVENPNEWLKERILDKSTIAIDTETKGLDCFSNIGKIRCITISYDGYTGYYLRENEVDNNILSEYLKDRDLVLTNGKFDLKWLHLKKDIPLDNMKMISDTVSLQQICNEMHRKGLKGGAFLYTNYGGYDKELDTYLDKHPEINNDYSLIPEEILFPYATTDPCITMQVHLALLKYRDELDVLLNSENKWGYNLKYCYDEIIIPSLNIFTQAEILGLPVDKDILEQVSNDLQKEISEVQGKIKEVVGNINVNSNDELGLALEKLGLPIIDRNEKGLPNVGETQLKAWVKEGYEIAETILYYREISKNFSTFIGMEDISKFGGGEIDIDSEDDFFDDYTDTKKKKKQKKGNVGLYKYILDDNRVHSTVSLFSTQSLRSRSFNMNMQQIPSHGDKAKKARLMYRPISEHHTFLSTDYSGIQLRLGALYSGDKIMRDIFINRGGNLHLMTAMSYVPFLLPEVQTFEQAEKILEDKKNPLSSIIKDYRFKAKSVNFLCEFGGSISVLSDQSILPDWKAEAMDSYIKANKLHNRYRELYTKAINGEFYYVKSNLSPENKILYTKAYIIAEDIHKKFFDMYQGLKNWIDNTIEKACEQGYSLSMYGTVRRLPYLLFRLSKDNDVNAKLYKNLSNISLNTLAQVGESLIINRSIVETQKRLKQKNLHYRKLDNGKVIGSHIFMLIHDAIETYADLDNNQYKEYMKIMTEEFTRDYPEYEGIPFEIESNISPTYQTGELWDMGSFISLDNLDNFNY